MKLLFQIAESIEKLFANLCGRCFGHHVFRFCEVALWMVRRGIFRTIKTRVVLKFKIAEISMIPDNDSFVFKLWIDEQTYCTKRIRMSSFELILQDEMQRALEVCPGLFPRH